MSFIAQDRRVVGRVIAGLLAVSGLMLFSGCSLLPKGGQTATEATKQLAALPGATKVRVEADGYYDGLNKKNEVVVHFGVADGYRIADEESLVSFLIRVAWSVNKVRPNLSLAIYVTVPAGQTVDAFAAATRGGWTEIYGKDATDPGNFQVNTRVPNDRLGDWPGQVPTLADDVIVPAS